ncbi:hypothetical protein [Chitinivibrio alkaliphilus]|uniref:Uncharacterized protein n=1 Tax=Chitinivibrio alkaliphilus ACht1 TaxID=1313304 RepID=U7D8W0_9BACT|nr:hypothetical protein [Chitinivibrio alkaliphilus]ERP39380.1 hypothetical protein CALK_0180 [Chitinivibrio alkaliphilus ACht1]
MFFKEADSAAGSKNALIVLLILVVLFLFRSQIAHGISSLFEGLATAEARRERHEYTETEQDSLLKEHHGFWVLDTYSRGHFSMREHLEIKENGYIYRHAEKNYALPYGDTLTIEWIREEFMTPLYREEDDSHIFHISDLAILKEGFITPGDSCLFQNPEGFREGVSARIDTATLSFQGRTYQPYEGDLGEFFPLGAYNMIRRTRDYPPCLSSDTPANTLRKALLNSLEKATEDLDNKTLMKEYFIPFLLKSETLSLDTYFTDEPYVDLTFSITAQGEIDSISIEGPLGRSRHNRLSIFEEMDLWRGLPDDPITLSVRWEYQ